MQPNFAEFGRIRMSRPNSAQFRRIRPNQAKPIQFSPIPPNSAEFGRIRPIRPYSTQFRRIRPNQANSGQFIPIPPNSAESSRIRPNQANSTQMDPIQPNSAEQGRIRQFRPNSTQFICGFALTSIIHSNQSLLYRCPIFETSATALRGTTGNLIFLTIVAEPKLCAVKGRQSVPITARQKTRKVLTARFQGLILQKDDFAHIFASNRAHSRNLTLSLSLSVDSSHLFRLY